MVAYKFFEDVCNICTQKTECKNFFERKGCLNTLNEANFVRLFNFLGFQWGSILKRNTKPIEFLNPVEWEGSEEYAGGKVSHKILRKTVPDFILSLPSSDIYIELKGAMIGPDKKRIQEALRVTQKYIVITKKILEEWEKIYSNLILFWNSPSK